MNSKRIHSRLCDAVNMDTPAMKLINSRAKRPSDMDNAMMNLNKSTETLQLTFNYYYVKQCSKLVFIEQIRSDLYSLCILGGVLVRRIYDWKTSFDVVILTNQPHLIV